MDVSAPSASWASVGRLVSLLSVRHPAVGLAGSSNVGSLGVVFWTGSVGFSSSGVGGVQDTSDPAIMVVAMVKKIDERIGRRRSVKGCEGVCDPWAGGGKSSARMLGIEVERR